MSKSLEKEYKEYIQMETPDLWDRIEKELSRREQQTEQNIEMTAQQSTEKTEEIEPDTEKKDLIPATGKKGRRLNVKRWATYGSLAAAALIVVAVVLFLGGSMKSSETAFDMCATDTAGGSVSKEDTAEEAVAMEEVAAAEDNAVEMSDAGENMNATKNAEAEEKSENTGSTTVVAEVTVTGVVTNAEGVVVYTGVTEKGIVYNFVLDEDVPVTDENAEDGNLKEGEVYSVELVPDGDGYKAIVVNQ